ncbi:Na/Pi symporter [Roseomonas sp. WA12]
MDLIASLLGGLGLFLVAVRSLGSQLHRLAGRRLRGAVAQATRGDTSAALTGIVLGALTQSSNAVTFITASMVQAGILPLARALPLVAWCNLGTAALVLVASLDIRLAALWLLGVAGLSLALGPKGGERLQAALGAIFQLGLLFLGLALLKSGAAPLRDTEAVRQAMAWTAHAVWPPFFVGAALALVAQSSSTVTILAISLAHVALLDPAQAGMAVCGASLGSGLSVMLLAGGLHGPARRLALFQSALKGIGAVQLAALVLLWHEIPGLPPLPASMDLADSLALLFVALQVLPALTVVPLRRHVPALLERLSPAAPAEALSRPAYLYDSALEDAPTALDLALHEQARLAGRLPMLLDKVRDGAPADAIPAETLSTAGLEVERAIETFLESLLARTIPRQELERAVAIGHLNTLLATLRETAAEFAGNLGRLRARPVDPALLALADSLAEALHLLLSEFQDAIASADPADSETLAALAGDRSAMMEELRRRTARQATALPTEALNLLFSITSLFERTAWLLRRSLFVLPEARGLEGSAEATDRSPSGQGANLRPSAELVCDTRA